MTEPSELPLVGFLNPRDRLPAFLVPVFGRSLDYWIQDSVGDGLVSRFHPCSVSKGQLSPTKVKSSQRVGRPLFYAFQISNNSFQCGNKEELQTWLQKNLHKLEPYRFLTLEVLNFIENTRAVQTAFHRAVEELDSDAPGTGRQWAISQKSVAQTFFEEAANTLMANTIHGTVNHFRKHRLSLDVRVVADIAGLIPLSKDKMTVGSILVSRFVAGEEGGENSRVFANIFIHKDASRHLARICIAKEVYVLIEELDAYLKGGRKQWGGMPRGKKLESDSDVFAWELCRLHDELNRSGHARNPFIHLPSQLFDHPPKIGEKLFGIPSEMALDSDNPFYSPSKTVW